MTRFSGRVCLLCLLSLCGQQAAETTAAERNRQRLIRILQSPTESFDRRVSAAEELGRLNPSAESILVKVMEQSPRQLQCVIALQLARTSSGAEALLNSIGQGKSSPRLLRQAVIHGQLEKANLKGLEQRLEKLTANLQPVDDEIEPIIRQRRTGYLTARTSLTRGKSHFQKQCAACHRVKEDGGRIGPDLDAIGRRGLDRLLEDLLDPHRNVEPTFRRTTVVTTDGEILSGLLVRGKGTQRILIDQQGKEVVLDQDRIEEAIVSPLSAMPTGLAGHLKAAEFYDLMAYLLSLEGSKRKP